MSDRTSLKQEIIALVSLLSLAAGESEAQSLQQRLQAVREHVKLYPTDVRHRGRSPADAILSRDTLFVYQERGMKIETCDRFTKFAVPSDTLSTFAYDGGSNGTLESVIIAKGRLSWHEEARVDAEGISGFGLSPDMFEGPGLLLRNAEQQMNGKTPYNTRVIIEINHHDSSATAYNFKLQQASSLSKDWVAKMQQTYDAVLRRAEKMLGIR